MNKLIYITILFFITNSCVKNNPDPSWIEIGEWVLTENPDLGTEKELTEDFSDVYITVDDEIVGFFELPVKLPILKEGNHKINLYPVVQKNGIKGHGKKIYPFCANYVINVDLVKNQSVKINPTTKYINGTKFWIEDFEDATLKISNESVSTANLLRDNKPEILQYGNAYGHIHLTSTDSLWYGMTSTGLNLPKGGTEVYLEIDYMNTNSFLTGVLAYSANGVADNPNIQVNPQTIEAPKWKKIYIELKEIVSFSVSATKFEHYFQAILDEGKSESDIYIDNIKIVYF
jgi:hypothetical protein